MRIHLLNIREGKQPMKLAALSNTHGNNFFDGKQKNGASKNAPQP
jgi:hypothetical protein